MKMNLKAEDNLSPIRNQIEGLTPPNSTVLEFGCGKGDLLFQLSSHIQSGVGIDKSKSHIHSAKLKKKQNNIQNIDFVCEELGENYKHSEKYDLSIASLFFHVIPRSHAIFLLNTMKELSNTVLICGFSRPASWRQETLLWLDQKFSEHYKRFKEYQKLGYMEGLLTETRCTDIERYDTSIPFIKVYKIK